MSQKIAQLIGQPEPIVKKIVTQLEDKNGYPSHDARLMAQNIQKIRTKLTDLGLDPDDTTGEELYHALLIKFERDSSLFDISYGAKDLDFNELSTKAASLIMRNLESPNQWVLKNTAAKNILRSLAPKQVMKQLHYRSVESLLKHEAVTELFLAAQYLESATWLKNQSRLVSQLDQTSFESRPLKIIPLTYEKWSKAKKPPVHIVENYSVGAVSIWPSADIKDAPLLSLALLLIDSLSSYKDIRLGQAAADLSETVSWWADMDHLVANLSSDHVSLSLKDCALNYLHSHDYEQRLMDHGQTSFWRELVSRYENQLDNEKALGTAIIQSMSTIKLRAPQPAYEFVEDF
jgi:hypothetical protein